MLIFLHETLPHFFVFCQANCKHHRYSELYFTSYFSILRWLANYFHCAEQCSTSTWRDLRRAHQKHLVSNWIIWYFIIKRRISPGVSYCLSMFKMWCRWVNHNEYAQIWKAFGTESFIYHCPSVRIRVRHLEIVNLVENYGKKSSFLLFNWLLLKKFLQVRNGSCRGPMVMAK